MRNRRTRVHAFHVEAVLRVAALTRRPPQLFRPGQRIQTPDFFLYSVAL